MQTNKNQAQRYREQTGSCQRSSGRVNWVKGAKGINIWL